MLEFGFCVLSLLIRYVYLDLSFKQLVKCCNIGPYLLVAFVIEEL